MRQSAEYFAINRIGKFVSITNHVLPLFASTLFLSAVLLFSIQPYFSKLVLPKLGGSPGVWSVAMVFFQSVLLLGYAYAHLLTRYLKTRQAIAVHALVLLAAAFFLPLGVAQGWTSPPAAHQELWLLGLFTVSIGLPFFAVAANAPLLQAWFARSGHKHANDPYFLYGASNIGSFASLFLYILVLEPNLTLGSQSYLWTAGYGFLVIAILACAGSVLRKPDGSTTAETSPAFVASAPAGKPLNKRQIFSYLGLAAVPSALTIAVTAHITVDIASAPFMWVVPLSLFLLTFVLTFRTNPLISLNALARLLPWVGLITGILIFVPKLLPLAASLGATLLTFFIAVLFCHARLYQLRPAASQLTAFYLWMSTGGVIGGVFAGLLAPNLFDWVIEYPLLMLAVLFMLPLKHGATPNSVFKSLALGGTLAVAAWIAVKADMVPASFSIAVMTLCLLGLLLAFAIVQIKRQTVAFAFLAMTAPVYLLLQMNQNVVHVERSFFGIVKVMDTESHRRMVHGTTVHGSIALSDLEAKVGEATPEPLAYYHESGPMAQTLHAARAAAGGTLETVGIVGLGTGSFLCHWQDGESWTAYEIDQAVIDVAANPSYFRFVSDCAPNTKMVVGDARLTVAQESDQAFDYLLIDAFSSDSIPVHLMTREAIALFFSKLSENGLLTLHISNRYMELATVLAAIAKEDGYALRFHEGKANAPKVLPDQVLLSNVAVLARDEADFGSILSDGSWVPVDPAHTEAWTDDYSNIIGAIVRMESAKK